MRWAVGRMRKGPARYLLDTNIWLYYFLGEDAHKHEIMGLIASGQDDGVDILFTPTTVKDLFYVLPRALRRAGAMGPDETMSSIAWSCVERMFELGTPAPQSAAECHIARMLWSTISDFEDAMIIAAAETAGADYIVTLDKKLLRAMPEVCVDPTRARELAALGL